MTTTNDAFATKHHSVNGAYNTLIDLSAMNEPVTIDAKGDHCVCTRQWGQCVANDADATLVAVRFSTVKWSTIMFSNRHESHATASGRLRERIMAL